MLFLLFFCSFLCSQTFAQFFIIEARYTSTLGNAETTFMVPKRFTVDGQDYPYNEGVTLTCTAYNHLTEQPIQVRKAEHYRHNDAKVGELEGQTIITTQESEDYYTIKIYNSPRAGWIEFSLSACHKPFSQFRVDFFTSQRRLSGTGSPTFKRCDSNTMSPKNRRGSLQCSPKALSPDAGITITPSSPKRASSKKHLFEPVSDATTLLSDFVPQIQLRTYNEIPSDLIAVVKYVDDNDPENPKIITLDLEIASSEEELQFSPSGSHSPGRLSKTRSGILAPMSPTFKRKPSMGKDGLERRNSGYNL